ncbi:DUF1365 domain-containing protein [Brucellaceae bacterium C25G]
MRHKEQKISGLFAGTVMHMRLRPKRHRFSYRVFSLFLDIDQLTNLDKSMRLFGYNRRALLSFYDKDHGDGKPRALRDWVEEKLRDAGVSEPKISIFILCYPRIFGYAFNPLTLYFCYDPDDVLIAILYEVSNTFGERHCYIIRVCAQAKEDGDEIIRQQCAKDFYVSPFIPMNCFYNFLIEPPEEKLLVRIDEEDADGMLLVASFTASRKPLNDRSLGLALLSHPLMTFKVSAGIYWEAFRLWKKGLHVYRHKAAVNRVDSTIVTSSSSKPQSYKLKQNEPQ